MSPKFSVGERVRYSLMALETLRQWVMQASSMTERSKRAAQYQEKLSLRGTIIQPSAEYMLNPKVGCSVQWDNGRVAHCLDYIVARAED